MKGNARGSGYTRNADDWYVEPPHAVRQLMDRVEFKGCILDPACGRGTIPRVVGERDQNCFASDLVYRGFGSAGVDFLAPIYNSRPDNIICNPPYRNINAWIARAVAVARRKVAIFAPLTLLEGIERERLFSSTPLAQVLVFSWRVNCPPGNLAPAFDAPIADWGKGGSKAYAWFVWDHAHRGEARVSFLPPVVRRNLLKLAA